MPSWNIHIAQAERVFARGGAIARTVADRNAFLLGCLVPDIYVGYMVPAITKPIAYRITHFATPAHIPKPREKEFWDAYVAPLLDRCGVAREQRGCRVPAGGVIPFGSLKAEQDYVSRIHYPQRYEGAPAPVLPASPKDGKTDPAAVERSVLDLVLGTWLHLVADNLWNTRVNQFLDAHGGKPSEEFRIKKQGDFDLFGKALPLDAIPRCTPRLIAAAAAFPQYSILERDLITTIGVAHEIVRTNHGPGDPVYRLLNPDFFEHVFSESVELPDRRMDERLGRG